MSKKPAVNREEALKFVKQKLAEAKPAAVQNYDIVRETIELINKKLDEGLTVSEVHQAAFAELGIKLSTFKSYVSRARRELEGEGDNGPAQDPAR